jgi:hypothetical protein
MDQCPQGGKSVHALYSHMSTLEFLTEPPVGRPVSMLPSSRLLGRHVVEYLAYDQYPLSASFGFEAVPNGVTRGVEA